MLTKIKKLVIGIFNYLGYTVTKQTHSHPVDLRAIGNNPKALSYYTGTDRQVLIDVDFVKGRGLETYSLSNDSNHPFIVAIKSALTSDDCKGELKDKLSRYYDFVQPQNAASWLGFEHGEVVGLDNQPAWLTLLPWENSSIEQKKRGRTDCADEDNKEHGSNLAIGEGWRDFGPVSEKVLELEVHRLYSLMLSIEKNGVMRSNAEGGDIGAIVLMKEDNDFCWMVEWGGQHRAAAISAMGSKSVPIRVWQVVERKDVYLWPNVQSGLYSIEAALKIFDKIFDGVSLSKVTQYWERYEKQ